MPWIVPAGDGCVLNLRVVPRAARNGVAGLHGDALKIRLQAPPVDNKANQALVEFLAEVLDIPAGRIRLLSGATGRHKRVALSGVSAAQARKALLADFGF
ncbi:MAG: DUF167 domain-containing protein [Lentisphaerae bacterium]|nr:DUF167 domain-containing protein [Lentisphaerota bacterium]